MTKDEIEKECVEALKILHQEYNKNVLEVASGFPGRISRNEYNLRMATARANYTERWNEIEGRYHDQIADLRLQ